MTVFTETAFRHGFDEQDFYEVLDQRPRKMRSRRGLKDVYEIYGRNFAGDYLHIALRRRSGLTTVFHMREMDEKEKRFYRRRK